MSRKKRTALIALAALGLIGAALIPWALDSSPKRRVVILGIDGMDPKILQRLIDEGEMPNFKRLIEQGDFKPLQTSMPPLSPVAWSNFITGMDPGGHGIYDFVARDPKNYFPHEAMAEAYEATRTLDIGSWVLPLSSGGYTMNRQGKAFWQILDEKGIPTVVYKMPVNFPPVEQKYGGALSGMGTPDLLGTPGSFAYYTDHPPENAADISGGKVYEVRVIDNRVDARLIGPKNPFRRIPKQTATGKIKRNKQGEIEYDHPELAIDFTVFLDPDELVAKLVFQDKELILQQGEWSDWVRVEFEAVPWAVKVSAIARLYMQQVRPEFRLYISPLQINPEEPAIPISQPEDWSNELFQKIGYFYTQTFPEENKGFSGGLFSAMEYWEQSQYVLSESRRALDRFLEEFKEGLLFFYFSSVDLNGHMLWRYIDPMHPDYRPDATLKNTYGIVYQSMDDALGKTMDAVLDGNTTLIVMSDHGFSRFYFGFNINSWLVEKGYIKLKNPDKQGTLGDLELFTNVDWDRTRAYASGLIGIYLNLKGRESKGVVPESEYDRLLDQLEKDLYEIRDPKNGKQVVTLVTRPRRDFHGPLKDAGPDIIVGYNEDYRIAWESTLGGMPRELFVDNTAAWSGDHQVDYRLVPGILVTNRKITLENPSLIDLTVGVLDEFGVPPAKTMLGRDCLGDKDSAEDLPAGQMEKLKTTGYLD
jgi:predicted AlkP superfamily phosphohydrolase/phosphomutase